MFAKLATYGSSEPRIIVPLEQNQPPVPLTQTVIAGQKAVFVTVAVEGSGHGSAAQSVTLQVLGPQKRAASTSVVVRC